MMPQFTALWKDSLPDLKDFYFDNEFQTMRFLRDIRHERQLVCKLSMEWLQQFEQIENIEFSFGDLGEKIKESKALRQHGNCLFTAKGDERNILGACRFYNDAIYAALDTKSSELALGFANRAMALQAFGYFQQAYDDCVCALKFGYPPSLRHKILARQAYCSIKMQDLDRAEKHLSELQKLKLSVDFSKDLKELLKNFDELKNEMVNGKENYNPIDENLQNRETQEIITTKNGSCLRAKGLIEKNQLIFTERAHAFLPADDNVRICHQCGTTNLIPIPCLHCHGRVNYCSLKCQEEHIGLHEYECPAYRFKMFANWDSTHLALRTLLDNGLHSILDELKLQNNRSTFAVWRKLDVGGDVWKSNSIPYAEILRGKTNFNKRCKEEILECAAESHLLVVYLKHYTKYFDVLKAKNENIDWEILTGSLLLRHIGQLRYMKPLSRTLIPSPVDAMGATADYMFNELVWSSAWHLKLGCLHYFSNYGDVAYFNLPYLGQCNHSCVKSFEIKFSGRFVSTYALRDLKKGDEITHCYIPKDYHNEKRETRRKKLQNIFKIECQCKNCRKKHSEDVEYNTFRQYRCENTKCGKIFVSNTLKVSSINLLQPRFSTPANIFCTFCGHKQSIKWHYEAKKCMCNDSDANYRRRLYQVFKKSEQYLVGLNESRFILGQQLITRWFYLPWINVPLNDQDYHDLIHVIKFVLCVTKEQYSINSIEYVCNMLYLWDLMAKRKYKCSKAEMDEMLWALSIVSDDLKKIFLNYYNDYIKDHYSL